MTNTLTSDPSSTIKQIHKIQEAGADIVRVSCPDKESTDAYSATIVQNITYNIQDSAISGDINNGIKNN